MRDFDDAKPFLLVKGDFVKRSRLATALVTGFVKELFKVDGATHIETYWVPKYVDAAMQKLMNFYGRTLAQ